MSGNCCKRTISSGFALIDSWEIIENSRVKRRMVKLEITLSEWFYNSIVGREILTINKDYFRLRKPIERRIYELARKHCGKQKEWAISLSALQAKTGSSAPDYKFRYFIKQIEKDNHLPDYSVSMKADIITFKQRPRANQKDPQQSLGFEDMPTIKRATIEKGARITEKAGTGWDYQEIRRQFAHQLMNGFTPDKVDGAFINFVKKKVVKRP